MRSANARRRCATSAAVLIGALSNAGLASAHVVMVPDTAKPGASYVGAFRISHGCSGSATTALRVEFPSAVTGVKPQAKAGWTVEIEREPLAKPVAGEGGKPVTTRVKAITWRGKLPDDEFDTFGVMLKLPATAEPLYIPAIQTCEAGANRWTDIPAPGQAWHSVPSPAPVITLSEAVAAPAPLPKGIAVTGGWTRTPPPGAPTGVGYLTITNGGPGADRLVSASSPVSERVEIHQMSMANGTMVMRPVEGGLAVPVGVTVKLAPGGYHLMLIGPKAFPKPGGHAPVTLTFEHAGKITTNLDVYTLGASPPASGAEAEMDHDHMETHQ